jgi:hypothetical protein
MSITIVFYNKWIVDYLLWSIVCDIIFFLNKGIVENSKFFFFFQKVQRKTMGKNYVLSSDISFYPSDHSHYAYIVHLKIKMEWQ